MLACCCAVHGVPELSMTSVGCSGGTLGLADQSALWLGLSLQKMTANWQDASQIARQVLLQDSNP